MKTMPESDWKKLRTIKGDVLNISCGRIFERIKKIIEEVPENENKAYLKYSHRLIFTAIPVNLYNPYDWEFITPLFVLSEE